jgi:hypothetical protein
MHNTRQIVLALFILLFSGFFSSAHATTIPFTFDASLQTGALSGTQFTGTASYNNQGETGIGTEYLYLTSLNFSLLGYPFTLADISQGGQAILQDGILSYFTAAFFPPSPASPVTAIAFGFGGPGIIGYVTPEQEFGLGAYTLPATIAGIPEPSTLLLFALALCSSPLLLRRRTVSQAF